MEEISARNYASHESRFLLPEFCVLGPTWSEPLLRSLEAELPGTCVSKPELGNENKTFGIAGQPKLLASLATTVLP